ncbi:MAG: DNA-directed RNA polymerase subunit alpha [Patescibacteria group bacterium]|nr:DNA-directed RNA polymerase subunit alpha [Patescibacteria group bacterium]
MENFPLPTKIEIKKAKDDSKQFIIEPLYPGYGNTIGNALRRVLLSSLSGAAVTAVKIKGVEHEFSTIKNVKEDVISIILNLKQINFKYSSPEPVKLILKEKGEKKVKAGDIKATADIEISNKNQVIANLTDKEAELEMELTVERGRGYKPVESREEEEVQIGNIRIDAIYTPIKNVNFHVENVRVGEITNFDRLILDIKTDGTLTGEQALKQAAELLVKHFNFVKGLQSTEKKDKTKKVENEKDQKNQPKEEEKKKITKEKSITTPEKK